MSTAAHFALPMLLALLFSTVRVALVVALIFVLKSFVVLFVLFFLLRFTLSRQRTAQRQRLHASLNLDAKQDEPNKVVGFFHPYCNAGGGGERVLWTALKCMQIEEKDAVFVVYTGDVDEQGKGIEGKIGKQEILDKVANRFSITLSPSNLHFVPLRKRFLIEDSTWPRFTLIGQSLGSIVLAYEGLAGEKGVVPDLWIDTMGYAFVYPLIRYLLPSVSIASYTHYPTISTDMLRRVRLRQAGHTNPSRVAKSWLLSSLKLCYYIVFASLYSWSLSHADVIMVNSTWTKRHIDTLLGSSPTPSPSDSASTSASSPDSVTASASTSHTHNELRRRHPLAASSSTSSPSTPTVPRTAPSRRRTPPSARIVYPPCDTTSLSTLPISTALRTSNGNRLTLFSLAQFRPEKEHPLQLYALASLFTLDPSLRSRVNLVCAGSVRNEEDEARVEGLKKLARDLEVEDKVEFRVNEKWETIRELMGRASVGLHTMVDEHFGIGVVEFQAAGLIPLAHASAGPLLDILLPYPSPIPGITGFLAPSPLPLLAPNIKLSQPELAMQFAKQLEKIVQMDEGEQDGIRERARESAGVRFGERVFERGWREALGELIGP
ncbi:hypothetical protein JCM11641_006375 [Rhodosporidiobolus odoratus]